MNYLHPISSIYQPINVFEVSRSSSGPVGDELSVARAMPQIIRTVIVPSGEISYVNILGDSLPFVDHVVRPDPASVSGVGNVHINWLETIDAHVIKADVPGMLSGLSLRKKFSETIVQCSRNFTGVKFLIRCGSSYDLVPINIPCFEWAELILIVILANPRPNSLKHPPFNQPRVVDSSKKTIPISLSIRI